MPIIYTDKKRTAMTNMILSKELILKQHRFFDGTGTSKISKKATEKKAIRYRHRYGTDPEEDSVSV